MLNLDLEDDVNYLVSFFNEKTPANFYNHNPDDTTLISTNKYAKGLKECESYNFSLQQNRKSLQSILLEFTLNIMDVDKDYIIFVIPNKHAYIYYESILRNWFYPIYIHVKHSSLSNELIESSKFHKNKKLKIKCKLNNFGIPATPLANGMINIYCSGITAAIPENKEELILEPIITDEPIITTISGIPKKTEKESTFFENLLKYSLYFVSIFIIIKLVIWWWILVTFLHDGFANGNWFFSIFMSFLLIIVVIIAIIATIFK